MMIKNRKSRMTFEQAKTRYVYRYTMEHVPEWAREVAPNGKYYAPHFKSDMEWFDNTLFGVDALEVSTKGDCYTTGETWPIGQWLDKPFKKGRE